MSDLSDSIYNKNLEIRYNEKTLKTKDKGTVKVDLKGKIRCPILNANVSSTVCSNLMDREGWPRNIKCDICQQANCFINMSIKQFSQKKVDNGSEKKH